jgi:Tol biopolymer transport system component/DNA-binding winged helix-turn-helix (wHTH) protein
MSRSDHVSPIIRFGVFELDLRAGELRRDGVKVKLQEQPLQILLLLLENPGQVVSREELQRRIWPADTFVEFDQGLYSALRRLREALSDSADNPRFVETLPRRGYRFIAPVLKDNGSSSATVLLAEPSSQPSQPQAESAGLPEPARPLSASKTAAARSAWSSVVRFPRALLALATLLLIFAGFEIWQRLRHEQAPAGGDPVTVLRLTDFLGIEELPAISPDGKTVAFIADKTGRRQVWLRLIAGGTPLQLTSDDSDHSDPRWTADSSALIYYSPPAQGEEQGSLWEVSALGGTPRPLTRSLSGADVSRDGKKLAFFRLNGGKKVELVAADRETLGIHVLTELPTTEAYEYPRWSPDDRWIAFQHSALYSDDISYLPAAGGSVLPITKERVLLSGFSWLPDGSGVIFSSGRGSTVLYLPTMHLWLASLDGSAPRQLSYGETSLQDPDVDRHGKVVASRLRMQFGIWKFPVDGTSRNNVRDAQQLTHETGQVQTPSIGPSDRELAYLSDDGGHGNIWVMDVASGATRQITTERDPRVAVGLPVWSPDGGTISLVSTRDTSNWETLGLWLINPDGSNLHRLASPVAGYPTWSNDGQWLYYSTETEKEKEGTLQTWKTLVKGGSPSLVRDDNACVSGISPDGSTLYFVAPQSNGNGSRDYEIRFAHPESGPSQRLARISGERVPHWQIVQATLSHDGRWLALPLNDGASTNLYLVSTADGTLRQVTDFGDRRTFIVRRVSWSSDDRRLFAAVGDGDADIVQIEGILPPR